MTQEKPVTVHPNRLCHCSKDQLSLGKFAERGERDVDRSSP